MQILKNKWLKSSLRYGLIALAVYLGFLIYANDSEAPVLSNFEVSAPIFDTDKNQTTFAFSGQVSDPKGISSAEIHCIQDGQSDYFIYLELFGGSKYLVSFGERSGSFSWLGGWDGSASDLTFEGKGKIPASSQALSCNWESRLKDSLGNYEVVDLGISTEITARP